MVAPIYRTNPDGTRVEVDEYNRSFEELVQDLGKPVAGSAERFLSRLGDHIRGVLRGTSQPLTSLGEFAQRMAVIFANRDEARGAGSAVPNDNPHAVEKPKGFETQVEAPSTQPQTNTPNIPAPVVVDASPSPAETAIAAMANGTATREQIKTFEQESIQRLEERLERTGDGNIRRALGVMNADGEISKNEYKVYQAIIEKSGIDLSGVGVSNAKDIDTTQELGKAIAAMSQQQSQVAQR